jgi:superfamily II DNA or RNA helicase
MDVSVGNKVMARGLEWDVLQVEPLGALHRLRLGCAGGDLQGLEWDVLSPPEVVTPLRDDPNPREIAPLDAWRRYHTAWLLDQIPGAPAPPGRIAIEAYQRVPLLRALDMARPRLLLADGVGLGKTIQAGLIAAELIVRRRGHRVLIVCPPGPLLRQWEQEMRLRFGLRFTAITDAASLRAARRGLELGGNPFESTALCLTSLDFAKQDHVLAELERADWDLVIIDEAHHCVGETNQRRLLATVLARKSDGLLLLTATPHDGHDPHFASLIALLDPSLVDADGKLIGNSYRRHVVRRLKSHIRDRRTGLPLFRERVIIPVRVDLTDAAPVRDFHQALSALVAPRLRRGHKGLTDALAFVSLLKRSMSSIAACVATLRVVAARYGDARPGSRHRALRALRRRMAEYGVLDPAAEAECAELEAQAMAADLAGGDTAAELAALIALGEAAEPHDPKLAALVLEVRLIRLAEPAANILVYTEYADSQRAAVAALGAIGGTVLTIGGADPESDRTRAAERCATEDGIVLVSTDSLAEGLNLQQRCHHLIHLDLPYNPNRLEQRNGRIDRYGQRQDPHIRYLYLAGTFEDRLLLHLIAKYEKARACLSVMPNTLAVTAPPGALREPLLAGFAETLFSTVPPLIHSLDLAAEDGDSESYRDLLREIDRAFQSFDRMAVRHGWMSEAETADPPAEAVPSGIDLAGFVAAVLDAATHGKPRADRVLPPAMPQPDAFPVPPEWRDDLDGLPGFDRARGIVRLTADPSRLRDRAGNALLFPGRAHPLTRRAIALARGGRTGRVGAARAEAVSLVLTYAAEAGALFRSVFAVQALPDGTVRALPDILAPAIAERSDPNLWNRCFKAWAEAAIPVAADYAAAVANRLTADCMVAHRTRIARDTAATLAWLERRATELCGPPKPAIGDLFQTVAEPETWRTGFAADRRLADFAADPAVPAPRRRDAAEALSRFRLVTEPTPPPRLVVRWLGMLMLCP